MISSTVTVKKFLPLKAQIFSLFISIPQRFDKIFGWIKLKNEDLVIPNLTEVSLVMLLTYVVTKGYSLTF